MTQRGTHARAALEAAAQLQTRLEALSGQARTTLKPALDALHAACDVKLTDGFKVADALPAAINPAAEPARAEAAALEEVFKLVGDINSTLNELTGSQPHLTLDSTVARGRIKRVGMKLHDLTRAEAMVEAAPVLKSMLEEKPALKRALGRLELCGEQAADLIEASDIARGHMSAARA